MTFNKLVLLASAVVTVFGASAFPFAEDYRSAGVVPLFTTYTVRDGLTTGKNKCLLFARKAYDGKKLLADKSKKRLAQDEDSAATAARAFFKHQSKYCCVYELAQALRTSAVKIHMGDHITYFLNFDVSELKDVKRIYRVWKNACVPPIVLRNYDVVIVHREDLKEAMNYGWTKRSADGNARNVEVRDAFGHLRTIMDKFLIGLTDNYSKIKYLFA